MEESWKMNDNDFIARLRKASSAVYLACDTESVADDLSEMHEEGGETGEFGVNPGAMLKEAANRIESAQAAIGADPVRKVLKGVEWNATRKVMRHTVRACPFCYGAKPMSEYEPLLKNDYAKSKFGHRTNCELAAALAEAEPKKEKE